MLYYSSSECVNQQELLLQEIISTVNSIKDVKWKRSVTISVVEELLTKRPYTKCFTELLFNASPCLKSSEEDQQWYDLAKLARECLKHLTAEDLRQLYVSKTLVPHEETYVNIYAEGVNGELSKIMMRYKNEGCPRVASPSAAPADELILQQIIPFEAIDLSRRSSAFS